MAGLENLEIHEAWDNDQFCHKRVFQIIAKINWGCLLLLAISLNVEDNYLLLNVSVLSQINESIGDSIIWSRQLKSNLEFLRLTNQVKFLQVMSRGWF